MNVNFSKEIIQEAKDIYFKSGERLYALNIETDLRYAVESRSMSIQHCLVETLAKLTEQITLEVLRISSDCSFTPSKNRTLALSPSISKFRDLKELDLSSMLKLVDLPEEIGSLENLEWLALPSSIEKVPDCLTNLQQLNLMNRARLQRRFPNLQGDWLDRGYKKAPKVNDDEFNCIRNSGRKHVYTRVNDHFGDEVMPLILDNMNFETLIVESGEDPEVQGYYRFCFKFPVPIRVYNIFFENFMLRYARDPKLGRAFEEKVLAFLGQSELFEQLAKRLTPKLKEKEAILPKRKKERVTLFREALNQGKIWYDEKKTRNPILDIKSKFFRRGKKRGRQVGDYKTVCWKRNRPQQLHKNGFS